MPDVLLGVSQPPWVEVPEGTRVHCEPEPGSVLLIFGAHERTTLKLHPGVIGPLVEALGTFVQYGGPGRM